MRAAMPARCREPKWRRCSIAQPVGMSKPYTIPPAPDPKWIRSCAAYLKPAPAIRFATPVDAPRRRWYQCL